MVAYGYSLFVALASIRPHYVQADPGDAVGHARMQCERVARQVGGAAANPISPSPSAIGLYNDGRACLRELMRRGVASTHMILFGHSLGSGVAVQMAEEFQVGGLMLLAPYLSIPKLARISFPFFPSSLLALDRFENEKKIGKIHAPVLIANGDEDRVIPPLQGNRLFALANQPKEFHSLPGRGHNDAFGQFTTLSIDWMGRACNPN